ncbi:MAG: ABC transporter permease [Cyclobacteriaceae bacterium]
MSFNLENEIRNWKAQLRKHKGFEDADIEELEDHLRSKLATLVSRRTSEDEAFQAILSEDYNDLNSISMLYSDQRGTSSLFPALLANYFKVGWRSFARTKTYFAINLMGLIIGLTSVLYIIFYVNFELNYDSFHENSEEIYRINTLFERGTTKMHYPIIPPAFGPEVKTSFSEIENAARLRYSYSVLMKYQDQSFYEDKVFFAEAPFFEMFSFKWKLGNPEGALQDLNTIVLTEKMATKYFGESDPLGQIITYNNEIDLKVIGVIEDVPGQSHFTFDFLISFETFKPGPGSLEPLTSWRWLGFLTYVQVNPNADIPGLEKKMLDLFQSHRNASNTNVDIQLQPLKSIYLTSGGLSNPQGGLFKVNDPDNLISLGVIAVLIIIISFFNYFNITSALMRTRSKEIGIRKVFGTSRRKVFVQMGSETLIIVALASLLSWTLILFMGKLELFQIIDESIIIAGAASISILVFFTLLSSVLFGSTFSSYSAMQLLRSKLSTATNSKFSVGRLVLLLQFGISAALIMVSLIVITQLSYFSKKDLGYSSDGIVMAKFASEEMNARRQTYVDASLNVPGVEAVSFGPSLDGSTSGSPLRLKEWPEDQVIQTAYFGVDYEFDKILDLEMVSGRFFSKEYARDSAEALIINETMAEMLGLEDPIGQKVEFARRDYEIVGVFRDFHYKSLHHEIGPLAMELWLGQPRNVMIKYRTENIGRTLQNLESTWKEVFREGGFPFDYRFLDEQLQAMYQKEQEFATLLKVFTSLAIFLALLGLFGLSSINIQQKIKQIGIRRVLGAEVKQIAGVVSKRYIVTSVLGIVVALPFAYVFMKGWLENFAYSIDLNLGFPIVTLLAVLGITALTLSYQVYRVMTVNPSSILRDE